MKHYLVEVFDHSSWEDFDSAFFKYLLAGRVDFAKKHNDKVWLRFEPEDEREFFYVTCRMFTMRADEIGEYYFAIIESVKDSKRQFRVKYYQESDRLLVYYDDLIFAEQEYEPAY